MTSIEPTPEPQPTPTPVETPPAAAETDWKAEAEKWKGITLKAEARANANAEAANKLREIEDRDLSELQKVQRDRDELSLKLTPLQQENARLHVALDAGLPKALASRLQGTTPEELAADAVALKSLLAAPAEPVIPQPKPDNSQGPQPVSPDAAVDADFAAYQSLVFPNRK